MLVICTISFLLAFWQRRHFTSVTDIMSTSFFGGMTAGFARMVLQGTAIADLITLAIAFLNCYCVFSYIKRHSWWIAIAIILTGCVFFATGVFVAFMSRTLELSTLSMTLIIVIATSAFIEFFEFKNTQGDNKDDD